MGENNEEYDRCLIKTIILHTYQRLKHLQICRPTMSSLSWEPTISDDNAARYLSVTSSLSCGDMLILMCPSYKSVVQVVQP